MSSVTVGRVLGNEKRDILYKEDPLLVSNTDGVGIEIEIENCQYEGLRDSPSIPKMEYFLHNGSSPLPKLAGLWKVVKDGSLRRGVEFIFDGPLEGANITIALQKLDEFFNVYRNSNNGQGVVTSDRCSVHVHLDVRDLSDKELTNLILYYLLFERVIFLAIDPERVKNNYCRPLTDSSIKYDLSNNLLNVSNTEDRLFTILRSISNYCDKYSALNILPLISKGSVEFRHHQGTTKPLELINWINIIFSIKKIAVSTDISNIIKEYSQDNSFDLVKSVFLGTSLGDLSDSYSSIITLMMRSGFNDVKEILYMNTLEKGSIKNKSRARPINTLLYQFKLKNNLITEEGI